MGTLKDDLAEVVRQMRAASEPNDYLLTAWANTIERHHAEILRNAEDAARYRWLLKTCTQIEAPGWMWEPDDDELIHPDKRFEQAHAHADAHNPA